MSARREPDALTGTTVPGVHLPTVQRIDAELAEPGHLNLRALSMRDGRVEGLEVESFEILPAHAAAEMAEAVAVVLSGERDLNCGPYLRLGDVLEVLPAQLVLAGGAL